MYEAIITYVRNAVDHEGVETHVYRIEFESEDEFEVAMEYVRQHSLNAEKLSA
jgi:hypothetical protein